jgi:hypothetical protein
MNQDEEIDFPFPEDMEEIRELYEANKSQLTNNFLLVSKAYVKHFVDKKLKNAHTIACILSYLEQKGDYYYDNGMLIHLKDEGKGNGWFYATADAIEKDTFYAEPVQTAAIKALKEEGLIDVVSCGLPCKRHFRLNIAKILKLKNLQRINQKNSASIQKMWKLDSENRKLVSRKCGNCNPQNMETAHIDNKKDNKKYREKAPNGASRDFLKTSSNSGEKQELLANKRLASTQHNINYVASPENQEIIKSPKEESSGVSYDTPSFHKCSACQKKAGKDQNKVQYGSHVKLTQEQYFELSKQFGEQKLKDIIERINDYCAATKPKGYSCYAATIRNWFRRDEDKQKLQKANYAYSTPKARPTIAELEQRESKIHRPIRIQNS